MIREEMLISTMHDITGCKLGDIEEELEQLEDLIVKRNLLRSWTQHPEGLELFGEELAEVEAEIAQSVGRIRLERVYTVVQDKRKRMLQRQRDWYQKRHDWLEQKLQMYRGNDEKGSCDSTEIKYDIPF